MNKMKYKLTIVVLYMIISSCNNTDSNEFAFSNYSWECPKEGGKEIFTSNKEEWKIDQLILDGIIIKEYSPLENTTGKSRSIKFICRHVNTYHTITVVQLPDINIIEHSGN